MGTFLIFAIFLSLLIFLLAPSNDKKITDLSVIPNGYKKIDDVIVSLEMQDIKDNLVSALKENKTIDDIDYSSIYGRINTLKEKAESEYNYLSELLTPLIRRSGYGNLESLKERFSKYSDQIKLEKNEYILYRNKSAALYTLQKLFTEVNLSSNRAYSGTLRVSNGFVRTKDVEGMKLKENGQLYVTNKRIRFIGDTGTIYYYPYSSIADDGFYEDNGIILKLINKTPVIIGLNKNFLYDTVNNIVDDSRLEAFVTIDDLVSMK